MFRTVAVVATILVSTLAALGGAQAQGRVAILMPGAGGAVPNDFLMRNQSRIEGAGIRTIVTSSPGQAASIAQDETAKGSKVFIVGMSKGVTHVATALASGAKVRGAVLVSGVYQEAQANLGSPGLLPPTLMIHNPADACPMTSPEIARSFAQWAKGRASLRFIKTRGGDDPRPCGPRGAHGFFMQDGPAISAMVSFIKSR